MTNFISTIESFSWQTWGIITFIPLLIYAFIELFRSSSLSQSQIIKDFVDTIDPEKLSEFIPSGTQIKSIKKKLVTGNLEYSSLTIRQAITFAIYAKRNISKLAINIESIDKLTGRQFEIYLSDFFKKRGYKVVITKASGDQGVDLLLYKDARKIAVQCKRYKQSNKVGNTAIQEVVTGKLFYDCTEAWVITTSTYTPHAIRLANKVGVKLFDRTSLITLLKG